MANKQKYFCLAYLIALFLLLLLSTFSNNWLKSDDDQNIGLWKECLDETGCEVMEESPSFDAPFLDWFMAVRAFMVLACIFEGFAVVLLLCHVKYEKYFRLKPVRFALAFDVIFLLLAVVVFGVEKHLVFEDEWNLHWSYFVTILNLILTTLALVFLCIVKDDFLKSFLENYEASNEQLDQFLMRSNDADKIFENL